QKGEDSVGHGQSGHIKERFGQAEASAQKLPEQGPCPNPGGMESAAFPSRTLNLLAIPRCWKCGRHQDSLKKAHPFPRQHQGDVVFEVLNDGKCAVWDLAEHAAAKCE